MESSDLKSLIELITQMKESLDGFRVLMDTKMGSVEHRLSRVEQRLTTLESSVKSMEVKVEGVWAYVQIEPINDNMSLLSRSGTA